MYSLPPATTGAGPLIDPPFARTPLSVGNSRFVSNCQTTEPSVVECARSTPSFDGEKTRPGIAVTAENSAPLQARLGRPHGSGSAGGASHTRDPCARSIACRPPGAGL